MPQQDPTNEFPRPSGNTTWAPFDPSLDVLHYQPRALDAIFAPKNVAVIGATEKEGSVGRTIVWNLIRSQFGGAVFPVNPKRPSILGIKAYPSICDVPDPVDLAVIVTPPATVPGIIKDCVGCGVKGAIIISAGFKEVGPEGVELEHRVMEEARRGNMRIIGPNCLGVMNPLSGLNATFATAMANPGNVGFISQSGALCTAVLDWSFRENVGFSAFVSIGSMLDVDWGDLIYYLGDDPNTHSIVIYMETIGNARSFISAAREVALTKPIIVIKPGRTEGAARAAASHTGSLTGSDEVLDAAFRRSGVLRVDEIGDLFSMAEVLSKQPRPKGPRLTILTNAGGPAVLATDALITNGGELAPISNEMIDKLSEFLPSAWSRNNPIDIIGDAGPDRYAQALEVAANDENSDGLLVILTPQAMTEPTPIAEALKDYASSYDKPILASWMGGDDIRAGEMVLNKANIPTFAYPDEAAKAFDYMWRFTYNLRGIYETPALAEGEGGDAPDREAAAKIIENARKAGRTILTEAESKDLLAAYRIPTTPNLIATSPAQAAEMADKVGYPVVLKLHSETITHKSDVGGVKLNLKDAAAVEKAFEEIKASVKEKAGEGHFLGASVQPMIKFEGYELIVGSSIDPQFGPVLLFGTGGTLVEVFKDRALGLPPLNTTLARRMIEQTKIHKALKGVRGRKSVDMDALEKLLVRFSHLISEQPWVKELDINPLLASPDGLLALDARVVIHDPNTEPKDLSKLAIRPYPNKYVSDWTAKDGRKVIIRPIRPEDEPQMICFHETLSDRTVYLRYLSPIMLSQRVTHDRLARMCCNDYDREIALVGELVDGKDAPCEIMGVARLSKLHGANSAQFRMLVSDAYQGIGLGSELLKRLIDVARQEKLELLVGTISAENEAMLSMCKKLGFEVGQPTEDKLIEATLKL
jgi:acetyltransferase